MIAVAMGRPGTVFGFTLSWDQADVILTDEVRLSYGPVLAGGDFNGDGKGDMVFTGDTKAMILLGKPLPAKGALGSLADWTILFEHTLTPNAVLLKDLNGDGMDDLILGFQNYQSTRGYVIAVFGRSGSGGVIDLTQSNPDVAIIGKSFSSLGWTLAVGNFNGDGFQDLLIGSTIVNEAYILWGAAAFMPNVVDLSAGGTLTSIPASQGGLTVAAGDINGDGKSEAFIATTDGFANGGYGNGNVYVVWGSSAFVPVPSIQILGHGGQHLYSPALGNIDDDGQADIFLASNFSSVVPAIVLKGSSIPAGAPTVNTLPGSPDYVAGVTLGSYAAPVAVGDFDGDGRSDLVGSEPTSAAKVPIKMFLSSFHPGDWQAGDSFDASFLLDLTGLGYQDVKLALGDINGDGREDLLVTRITNPLYFSTQHLIFYGFTPLRDPHIQVVNKSGRARVDLVLSVDGEPSEMRLGGDILDSFRDQWIPFKPDQAVTLTSAPEEKTITAVFRNGQKRESDAAQAKVPLTPGRTGAELISNRVRPNGKAVVECPMESAGRLRAALWTSDGNHVVDLVDEDRDPGVYTLEWDGRNGEGKRVSPGVYILRLDVDGHVERKKILVQG